MYFILLSIIYIIFNYITIINECLRYFQSMHTYTHILRSFYSYKLHKSVCMRVINIIMLIAKFLHKRKHKIIIGYYEIMFIVCNNQIWMNAIFGEKGKIKINANFRNIEYFTLNFYSHQSGLWIFFDMIMLNFHHWFSMNKSSWNNG